MIIFSNNTEQLAIKWSLQHLWTAHQYSTVKSCTLNNNNNNNNNNKKKKKKKKKKDNNYR